MSILNNYINQFIENEINILDSKDFWVTEPKILIQKFEEHAKKSKLQVFASTKSVYSKMHNSMKANTYKEFIEQGARSCSDVYDIACIPAAYEDVNKTAICTIYEQSSISLKDLLDGLKTFYSVEETLFIDHIFSNRKLYTHIDRASDEKTIASGLYSLLEIHGADNVLCVVGGNRWENTLVNVHNEEYLFGTPYFRSCNSNATMIITSGVNRVVKFKLSKEQKGFHIFLKSYISNLSRNTIYYFSHR